MLLVRRYPIQVTVLLAVGLQITAFLLTLWQPPITEDADFFAAATRWYVARDRVPHPQLAVHNIQLFMALFGQNFVAARLSSLVPSLITVGLVPWLAMLVTKDKETSFRQRIVVVFATMLFAASPFAIQNELLVNIDNALLTTVLTLFLCLWFATENWSTKRRLIVLSMSFTLCLWTKLTSPPLLFLSILAYETFRRDWRAVRDLIAVGVFAAALFTVIHLAYWRITGFNIVPVLFGTFGRATGTASTEGFLNGVSRAIQSLGVFVLWLGIPATLLLLPAIWQSVQRARWFRIDRRDLLLLYGLIIVLVYALFFFPAWGYPRYQSPALPVLSIVIARQLASAGFALERRTVLILAGISLGTCLYLFLFVGDPFYKIYQATFETVELSDRLATSLRAAAALMPPMIAAMIAGLIWIRNARTPALPSIVLVLGALSFGFAIETNFVQLTANYSTRYRYTYSYSDRADALKAVERRIPLGGYILADLDILDYADRNGELIYQYVCPNCAPERFVIYLNTTHIDGIVWAEKEWLKAPQVSGDERLNQLLDRCFERESYGIFTFLVRALNPGCTLP